MMATENILALPEGYELNHYVLESVIGQGGFGVVYKAHHAHLEESVVIKEFLPNELATRHGFTVLPHGQSKQQTYTDCLQRFLTEGKTLVKLRHPNVVRCRDLFTSNGTAYLVMDFEDGMTLESLLYHLEQVGGRYNEIQLLHFLLPLAQGIAYIHSEGVLHRDLKPANVFIRRSDGSPVIIDFGAAKQNFANVTKSHAPYTDFYAPIEQIEGGAEAKATIDIHAFGALMYRAVTGRLGAKAESRAMAIAFNKPDPLVPSTILAKSQVSNDLLTLIDSCIEFDASRRPQTMGEVIKALQECVNKITNDIPTSSSSEAEIESPLTNVNIDKSNQYQVDNHVVTPASKTNNPPDSLTKQKSPYLWGALVFGLSACIVGISYLVFVPAETIAAKPRTPSTELSGQSAKQEVIIKEENRPSSSAHTSVDSETIRLAQHWLYKAGYDLKVTGVEDKETIEAIKKFESDRGMLVTGKPTLDLANNAEDLYWQQDAESYASAQKSNTIRSYNLYLNSFLDGKSRVKAIEAKALLEQVFQEEQRKITEQKIAQQAELKKQKELQQQPVLEDTIDKTVIITEEQAKEKLATEQQAELNQEAEEQKRLAQYLGEFITVPAGKFLMGCVDGDRECLTYEYPSHQVNVASFKMMATEVTSEMWQLCAEQNACTSKIGKKYGSLSNKPVVSVSYQEIVEQFIPWLEQRTGFRFRLPSESEWEYAARAGTTTKYYWGNNIVCGQAMYGQHKRGCGSQKSVNPVKSYLANPFGFYDMHGNAWEWTEDCWNPNYQDAPIDGTPWQQGECTSRVVRGGAWSSEASFLRASYRFKCEADYQPDDGGFRLVLIGKVAKN